MDGVCRRRIFLGACGPSHRLHAGSAGVSYAGIHRRLLRTGRAGARDLQNRLKQLAAASACRRPRSTSLSASDLAHDEMQQRSWRLVKTLDLAGVEADALPGPGRGVGRAKPICRDVTVVAAERVTAIGLTRLVARIEHAAGF